MRTGAHQVRICGQPTPSVVNQILVKFSFHFDINFVDQFLCILLFNEPSLLYLRKHVIVLVKLALLIKVLCQLKDVENIDLPFKGNDNKSILKCIIIYRLLITSVLLNREPIDIAAIEPFKLQKRHLFLEIER